MSAQPPPLIALFGPTAVGKTEVALELAEMLRERGEDPVAVSADAFQLYEGLDVLTAKPSPAQLERLEHRLVSTVPVDQSITVAQYAERAHEEIDSLLDGARRPIVVGGTGLYLRAALTRLDLKPPPAGGLREEIESELERVGPQALHAQLPAAVAGTVHPNDRKRIVRAVELERMGERPYDRPDQLWSDELRRPAVLAGISMDRDELAQRIAARVRSMVDHGIVEEVETAIERGASRTARKAIGFEEIAAHLNGQVSLSQAAERIERRHRQYVKRQLTWMRKLAGVQAIDRSALSPADAAAITLERLDSLPRP